MIPGSYFIGEEMNVSFWFLSSHQKERVFDVKKLFLSLFLKSFYTKRNLKFCVLKSWNVSW